MSEKVRYYLEQSVTELQDLKKRGIFGDEELKIIMKRRTEYEHRITARTAKPSEFLAYANYEINVDKLRTLRVKRLRKAGSLSGSGVSDWAGSRRIMFIFDRGTKKFPQNLNLWMRTIDYAKQQNAVNVINKSMSSMLKLHPTNPEVWVYVAKYQAEDNASIQEARAVLQRGLRFNADSVYLWAEYMRLELIYVAKILARRKLLGIQSARKSEEKEQNKEAQLDLSTSDVVAVESELKNLPDINIDILGDVSVNPALRGDVALAVFDAGAAQLPDADQMELSERALDIFDLFTALDRTYLCDHVIQWASQNRANDPKVKVWALTLPVRHCARNSSQLPDQLRILFNLYSKEQKHSLEVRQLLREYLTDRFLADAASEPPLDENLRQAIELFLRKL